MSAVRNPDKTRNSLLAAAASVLRRHYLDTSGNQSVIPISVTDIVTETAKLDTPEFAKVTTGAVKTAFGTKHDLLRAAASAYGRDWYECRYRPKGVRSGSQLMRGFFENQLSEASGHISESRHWLQLCAHAGDPLLNASLSEIRTTSIESIAVWCELSGDMEERAPKFGGWSDIAEVLLTWIEGVGVRVSQNCVLEGSKDMSQAVEIGLLLWTTLTEPTFDAVPPKGTETESPLTFVSVFEFDELEHWLDDQAKVTRRASTLLRKSKLHVPQFEGSGYKPEVTVSVVINSAGSRNESATALVALSLISESDAYTERGREVKATIVSVDGREFSALIDGWGKRPTAEIVNVPVTTNSPRDLTLRWEVLEQGN